MGIAFNAAADLGNNGGSGNLTVSYTLGTGSNLLVVGIVGDNSTDNVSAVTYGGVSMTLAKKQGPIVGGRWAYLWYLSSPSSGANNVVVTNSGGYVLAGAADYTGALTTGQPDNTATNTAAAGTQSSLTVSLTPVASNCWTVLFGTGYEGGPAPMAGTGSTRRASEGAFGTWGLFDSNAGVTGGSSYSMTYQYGGTSSNDLIGIMVSFAPSGGGGGTNYTLSGGVGSFVVTGKPLTPSAGRPLAASVGSFTLAGKTTALNIGRYFAGIAGAFAVSGHIATTDWPRKLSGSAGSFTLTGEAATFVKGKGISGAAGSFVVTGEAATTNIGRTLAAPHGSFVVTGETATTSWPRKLSASAGSFTVSGEAATLARGKGLSVAAGSFTVTGETATTHTARTLAASAGAFSLSGQSATLTISGGPVTEIIVVTYGWVSETITTRGDVGQSFIT